MEPSRAQRTRRVGLELNSEPFSQGGHQRERHLRRSHASITPSPTLEGVYAAAGTSPAKNKFLLFPSWGTELFDRNYSPDFFISPTCARTSCSAFSTRGSATAARLFSRGKRSDASRGRVPCDEIELSRNCEDGDHEPGAQEMGQNGGSEGKIRQFSRAGPGGHALSVGQGAAPHRFTAP
jgi:hypothetical protein